MKPASLSEAQARRLVLRAQGLDRPAPFGAGAQAAQAALEHLGYVQIDTISVVERAHHHVLWARLPDYRPALLHELQTGARTVFEYWSHAASYLPMRDYRYCLPRMRAHAQGKRHWFARDLKTMAYVRDRIRAEGALQARDFEAPKGRRGGPWFEWKPAKRALEQLFIQGELMIRERRGFQKVYDLAERVLPPGTDTRLPTPHELACHLARHQLRAFGLALEPEIRYLRRIDRKTVAGALAELEERGEVTRVRVEGGAEHFAAARGLDELPGGRSGGQVRILSPFDNLVIQRKRLARLFGFDYQIECYVPAPKRRHGYFVLPVLAGDRLVGRLDAKAARERKVLEVLRLWPEPGVARGALVEQLRPELERFARFNGCETVRLPPGRRS